jgi:hypothetical protein
MISVSLGVMAQAVAAEPREPLIFTVTMAATSPGRRRLGSILPK